MHFVVDNGQLADEGLSDVFLTHRPALRAFLRARCAQHVVDDLLQELWLEVQYIAGSVTPDPLSHLYRAAHRLVVERGRGASRGDRRNRPRRLPDMESALITPRRVIPAPQALRGLGMRVEQVFRRYRLGGASPREIAAELNLDRSIVEMDLRRAYAALLLPRMTS